MASVAPDPLSAARERLRRLEQLKAEGLVTDEEYAAKRTAIVDDATDTTSVPPSRAPSPPLGAVRSSDAPPRPDAAPNTSKPELVLRAEVERRTRRGWHVVSESTNGVQLRKPKHFGFGWALLWFVLAFFPFVVYLLWHWSKKDQYVLLSVGPDGALVASDRSRLWGLVKSYAHWGSTRPHAWQRVAAFGVPVLAALVLVGRVVDTAGSSGDHAPQSAPAAATIPTAPAQRGAAQSGTIPTPAPKIAEDPGQALVEIVRGNAALAWQTLDPTQQVQLSQDWFMECKDATPAGAPVTLVLSVASAITAPAEFGLTVEEAKAHYPFPEQLTVDGVTYDTTAVMLRYLYYNGQQQEFVFHVVLVDGTWRWLLRGGALREARKGNCDGSTLTMA